MINSLLVLVSLSVYTFDVSKTMFEDKEGVRTITARLQGEDKPSPLLCYAQVATSSIVGESCLGDRYNGLSSPWSLAKSYAHPTCAVP